MTSSSPVKDITSIMQNFWIAKYDPTSALSPKEISGKKERLKRIALHLGHYILHRNDLASFYSPHLFQLESLLALRQWTSLSALSRSMDQSPFAGLSDKDKRDLLFEEGLCVGGVVKHFEKFFTKLSPLSSIFPIASKVKATLLNGKAYFHPFTFDSEKFTETTRSLRFVQAAYRITSLKKKKGEVAFLPANVLEKFKLKFVRRIPDIKDKFHLHIDELIPEFNKCSLPNKAYVLAVSNGVKSHALAVYPSKPFHFVDPSMGIGTTENVDDLFLFLANYLNENYSTYETFALLELEAVKSPSSKSEEASPDKKNSIVATDD